jgi:hypothetical protein
MDIHIGGVTPVKQANKAQCWYASATMAYRHRGKPDPVMVGGDAADEGMWSFSAMEVLVNKYGFTPIDKKILKLAEFSSKLLGALMLSVECPLVCIGEYQPGVRGAGHVVVVYRVTKTTVYYIDPFEPREKEMSFEDFNRKLFKEMDPSCVMWLPK